MTAHQKDFAYATFWAGFYSGAITMAVFIGACAGFYSCF